MLILKHLMVFALIFMIITGTIAQDAQVAGINLVRGNLASSDGNDLPKTIQKRETSEECIRKVNRSDCFKQAKAKYANFNTVMGTLISASISPNSSKLNLTNEQAFCPAFGVYIKCRHEMICEKCGPDGMSAFRASEQDMYIKLLSSECLVHFNKIQICTIDMKKVTESSSQSSENAKETSHSPGKSSDSNKMPETTDKPLPTDSPKDNSALIAIIIAVVVILSLLFLAGILIYIFNVFVKKNSSKDEQSVMSSSSITKICRSKSTTGRANSTSSRVKSAKSTNDGAKSASSASSAPSIRSKV